MGVSSSEVAASHTRAKCLKQNSPHRRVPSTKRQTVSQIRPCLGVLLLGDLAQGREPTSWSLSVFWGRLSFVEPSHPRENGWGKLILWTTGSKWKWTLGARFRQANAGTTELQALLFRVGDCTRRPRAGLQRENWLGAQFPSSLPLPH